MADCLFCRIARGEIPAQKVFESETVLAIRDIHPKAPVHVLILPKQHIPTLNDLPPEGPMGAALLAAAGTIARQLGVADAGYRLIANTNRDGGQEVYHLHFHLLGGRRIGRMVADG